MPLAMSEPTTDPELEPTYRSKSLARKRGRASSSATSAPTSYIPPITPPPASTSARLAGRRNWPSLRSSELSAPVTSPPQQRGPPREAGAESHQHHEVVVLDSSARHSLVETDGHGGARGVAVALDVDDQAIRGNRERPCHGLDDPQVGLVEDEEIDVSGGEPVGVQALLNDLTRPLHGVHEHGPPVHARPRPIVVDLLLR